MTAAYPRLWLELWDRTIVCLCDPGPESDVEVAYAASDYDVPDELIDEFWRLNELREDAR